MLVGQAFSEGFMFEALWVCISALFLCEIVAGYRSPSFEGLL